MAVGAHPDELPEKGKRAKFNPERNVLNYKIFSAERPRACGNGKERFFRCDFCGTERHNYLQLRNHVVIKHFQAVRVSKQTEDKWRFSKTTNRILCKCDALPGDGWTCAFCGESSEKGERTARQHMLHYHFKSIVVVQVGVRSMGVVADDAVAQEVPPLQNTASFLPRKARGQYVPITTWTEDNIPSTAFLRTESNEQSSSAVGR